MSTLQTRSFILTNSQEGQHGKSRHYRAYGRFHRMMEQIPEMPGQGQKDNHGPHQCENPRAPF